MSTRMRIALGTVSTFNALILSALGLIAAFYVNGAAGPVAAGVCWLSAGALFGIAHWLRRDDW